MSFMDQSAARVHELNVPTALRTEQCESVSGNTSADRCPAPSDNRPPHDDLYRVLFENSSDAVLLIEGDSFTTCNRAALALFGLRDSGELRERHLWYFAPPFQPDGTTSEAKARALFAEALRTGSMRSEWVFQRADGATVPFEVALTAIQVPGKRILHAVWRDITERKQAERELTLYRDQLQLLVDDRTAELNLARQRVEAILNHSVDGIVLADTNTGIVQSNFAFNSLFACEPDDYFGMPLVALVHLDDAERLMALLHEVIAQRAGKRLEIRALRKDGGIIDAEFGIGFISAGTANGDRLVCSIRDVTERKRAEKVLVQALAREKELGELKSRFVSMVSHEFRTPLATIQATADTLHYYLPKLDVTQIEARFNKIQAQVKHMTVLLEDVLTFGWLQSNRVEFNPVPLNVYQLCQEIVEDLRSFDNEHHIAFSCVDETLTAEADPKLLRQVISNLLTNAIKYSPNGKIVRLDVYSVYGSVTFKVSDAGIGIPAADQANLFEAFYRASNVGHISGTGLGLVVTQHAVDLHKGSISLESMVGVGTTFVVSIPIDQRERQQS